VTRRNIERSTVEYLLEKGRLEQVSTTGVAMAADRFLTRAEMRLVTARAGFGGEDIEGAFVAAYDAYRMAAESLLLRQGLRVRGGEGSHMTVEDAVSAQFSGAIAAFAKPTFERFRRMRHVAQYFDPEAPELTSEDTLWAITTAAASVEKTRQISEKERLQLFEPHTVQSPPRDAR